MGFPYSKKQTKQVYKTINEVNERQQRQMTTKELIFAFLYILNRKDYYNSKKVFLSSTEYQRLRRRINNAGRKIVVKYLAYLGDKEMAMLDKYFKSTNVILNKDGTINFGGVDE